MEHHLCRGEASSFLFRIFEGSEAFVDQSDPQGLTITETKVLRSRCSLIPFSLARPPTRLRTPSDRPRLRRTLAADLRLLLAHVLPAWPRPLGAVIGRWGAGTRWTRGGGGKEGRGREFRFAAGTKRMPCSETLQRVSAGSQKAGSRGRPPRPPRA